MQRTPPGKGVITVRFANVDNRLVMVAGDRVVDVATASQQRFGPDPLAALEKWPELLDWAGSAPGGDGRPAQPDRFSAPVPRPRQVFALALNYPMHAAEARLEAPADPLVFTKFPSCLTGPDTTVTLPSDRVDWEVELVVVIGPGGHRIPAERAWAHVAGLTIGQDLSERSVQLAGPRPQFSLGKSFPGFGPTGPVLVTRDELADPGDLEITCTLNGTVVQQARTSDMIFPVPETIAWISAICPLSPGDLIFTGTPAGVGHGRDPRRYLRPGDELVSSIEGIGEIRTRFAAAPPA
jgi:2-keto-4-pentenoate hydratase/2-oxohepta-3-ene-1,7-dioic acid hydratase in catechol pathway